MTKRLGLKRERQENRRMLIHVCYSEWSIIHINHRELNMLSAAASLLYESKCEHLLFFVVFFFYFFA